jgi:hypothetical protein
MPSPFPGMDPYLEARDIWPDVHLRLIAEIARDLSPQVAPAYYVAVEQRTYIIPVEPDEQIIRPDVALVGLSSTRETATGGVATAIAVTPQIVLVPSFESVHEGYLEIRAVRTHEVITVAELLSPTNKISTEGRREYETKRRQVLSTMTNLVEIDLLRAGEPMAMEPRPDIDYRVLIRRGWERPRARLYRFAVRDPLADIPLPLREGEPEALLRPGKLLSDVYDAARYDLRLDYRSEPPEPPLTSEDAAWMEELLREKGLRG